MFSLRKAALQVPLAFDPGTKWEYGIGIDWAGQMVERVSGQTLGEFFAEHLTGPLGMADTSFVPAESVASRRPAMHARLPGEALAAIGPSAPEQPEFEMGGGGLHGTMGDYARFVHMILSDGTLDGTRRLAPDTVAQMATNHIRRPSRHPASDGESGVLRRRRDVHPRTEVVGSDVPLPRGRRPDGPTFRHAEPGRTRHRYFWVDRTNGVGGCYLTQILPFADQSSLELYEEFERTVHARR